MTYVTADRPAIPSLGHSSPTIGQQATSSVERQLASQQGDDTGYLFRSRANGSSHTSAWECARIAHRWISNIGLDDPGFGTHPLRRTKAAQPYRKAGNPRAVQLLLGHAKIETGVAFPPEAATEVFESALQEP